MLVDHGRLSKGEPLDEAVDILNPGKNMGQEHFSWQFKKGEIIRIKSDFIHWSGTRLLFFWEEETKTGWSEKTKANDSKTQDMSDKDLIFSVVF